MRLALHPSLLLVVLAAAGCTSSSGENLAADDGSGDGSSDGSGGGAGGSPEVAECQLPSDCVPANSTCCECPAFAVPAASGYEEACADVACDPAPTGCALTEPACLGGRCELVCSPVVTDLVCETGFARDDFGCLLDACADSGGVAECDRDADCVEVPADCCGCASGGSDTAVPAGSEADYHDSLSCPPDPSCPDVNVCDPDSAPRCIAGSCQLVTPPSEPDGDTAPSVLCGTADTAPCPDGQVCVLNHPDASDATQAGAGSCQIP